MESVYIETTILSYLVALPAKDVVIAGHQKTTLDWWAYRRTAFECFISQVVIDEISAGDPSEVRKRLYLLTWNCKHLANAQIAKRVANLCRLAGFEMPTICTPEELFEEPSDEE